MTVLGHSNGGIYIRPATPPAAPPPPGFLAYRGDPNLGLQFFLHPSGDRFYIEARMQEPSKPEVQAPVAGYLDRESLLQIRDIINGVLGEISND